VAKAKSNPDIGMQVVVPARAFRLQVPWLLAAGQYEKLTTEELLEHYYDIRAEIERRTVEVAT
jgi:hypothetical protein